MKELQEIHDKFIVRGLGVSSDHEISFSRDSVDDAEAALPEDLLAEIRTLQQEINACLPEDIDYLAYLGVADMPPGLELLVEENPTGDIDGDRFDRNEPLIPQLKALDWDEVREQAEEEGEIMDDAISMFEFMQKPLRATKQVQREFDLDLKDFVKAKRVDAAQIHVLWHDAEGLYEKSFTDAEELRKTVAVLMYGGGELISVVVRGKPLPAPKIDALNSDVKQNLPKYLDAAMEAEAGNLEEADDEGADDGDDVDNDGVIDVESTVIDEDLPPKK